MVIAPDLLRAGLGQLCGTELVAAAQAEDLRFESAEMKKGNGTELSGAKRVTEGRGVDALCREIAALAVEFERLRHENCRLRGEIEKLRRVIVAARTRKAKRENSEEKL